MTYTLLYSELVARLDTSYVFLEVINASKKEAQFHQIRDKRFHSVKSLLDDRISAACQDTPLSSVVFEDEPITSTSCRKDDIIKGESSVLLQEEAQKVIRWADLIFVILQEDPSTKSTSRGNDDIEKEPSALEEGIAEEDRGLEDSASVQEDPPRTHQEEPSLPPREARPKRVKLRRSKRITAINRKKTRESLPLRRSKRIAAM